MRPHEADHVAHRRIVAQPQVVNPPDGKGFAHGGEGLRLFDRIHAQVGF